MTKCYNKSKMASHEMDMHFGGELMEEGCVFLERTDKEQEFEEE